MTTATAEVGSRAAPRRSATAASRAADKRALYWSYFFLILFVIFFLMPPRLHADHLAQDERGDRGGDQPLVGLSPDLGELHRLC